MNGGQLRALLKASAVNADNALVPGDDYVFPAKDWVANEFASALSEFLQMLGVSKWAVDSNDCEDFARWSAALAQRLNFLTRGDSKTALAFGEFWYYRDDGSGHAVNVFLCNSQFPEVCFFEPQTQQIVTLSHSERWNCIAYRF